MIDEVFHFVYRMATNSMDPRTKIGSVVVKLHSDHHLEMHGAFNQTPLSIPIPEFESRGLNKHQYMEHAERLLIRERENHGADLSEFSIAVNEPPCQDCCRAIINAGIKKVYTCGKWYRHAEDKGPSLERKTGIASAMMEAAGGSLTVSHWHCTDPTLFGKRDDMEFRVVDY